ncbi:MAG: hypothetical protein UH081_00190 [Clostridia bacterium]|nr:hypothetical protein [Clostridia bacterium]
MKKRIITIFAVTMVMLGIYNLSVSAARIKNMSIDTFDREVPRITASTSKKEYQGGSSYLYDGLGGFFDGVYFREGNSSWLSDGDYVEIVKSAYDSDRCLHIHSDAYTEGENKYIEMYQAPEVSLDAEYNFIYEMDLLFDDSICGLKFAIKPGVWRNVEFDIPLGSRVLNSKGDTVVLNEKEWHHIAIVLHKDSAVFSFYVDGKVLFERKSLIPAPDPSMKPGRFSSITMKTVRGDTQSDLYVDNVRWYEQYEDYDYTKAAAEISSEMYSISGREIYNVSQIRVSDFLENISLSSGAYAAVTERDRMTEVRSEKPVYSGMYLVVTASDGLSRKFYKINGTGKVKFYNQSGTEIKCVSSNKTITAKSAGNANGAQLIMALYNAEGELIGTGLFENGECTLAGIENPDECYVKVYNWSDMKPQADAQYLKSSPHPFMLVTKDDFMSLEKKAAQSPWKEIKANAVNEMRAVIDEETVAEDNAYAAKCSKISNVVSAAALTYIINPELREESKAVILDMINFWNCDRSGNIYDYLYPEKGDYFSRCVPPATTFTYCLLALDIIHDDISEEQLLSAEALLEKAAKRYISTDEGHMVAVLGVRGIWGIYADDEQLVSDAWNEWLTWYNGYMSADGVGSMGTEYATVRFISNERMAKEILPIVMEHTGRIDGFFDTDKYADFAEWAIGYTYAPVRRSWAIGDTSANRKVNSNTQMAFRVSEFSDNAAHMRSFVFNNCTNGNLINYLTVENTEPKAPESRIFKDGGAWFYEDLNNTASLGGFLLNSTASDGHAHKEINSVNIAAYGEILTVNAGYNKWNTGVAGYTWNYINNRAVSANTVLVDYEYDNITDPPSVNDHIMKSGAGITNSLIADKLAYAVGNSGKSLPNAVHERSFMMIEPEGNVPGYFILGDKVSAGSEMTVVHRPFSDNGTEVSANKEYTWTINRSSGHDVGLSVYLASKPVSAVFTEGIAATWENSIPLNPLIAKYSTDKRALTVLYPYDSMHSKAVMTRIVGAAEGVVISSGDTVDYLIQNGNFAKSGAEYTGEFILVRKTGGVLSWFFTENVTAFSCDGMQYFTADNGVSVFMDNKNVNIMNVSAQYDTVITVNSSNISSVYINGKEQPIWNNDGEKASFMVPSGENIIEIKH